MSWHSPMIKVDSSGSTSEHESVGESHWRSPYTRHGPLTGRPLFAGRVVPPAMSRHQPRHGLLRAAGRHASVSNRVGPCSDQAELPCHGPCLGPTGCMHIFTPLGSPLGLARRPPLAGPARAAQLLSPLFPAFGLRNQPARILALPL